MSSAKLIYISYTMLSFLFFFFGDDEGLLNRCEMFKNERVLFDVMTWLSMGVLYCMYITMLKHEMEEDI